MYIEGDLGAFRPAINSFNPTWRIYFDVLNLSVARQEEPVQFLSWKSALTRDYFFDLNIEVG